LPASSFMKPTLHPDTGGVGGVTISRRKVNVPEAPKPVLSAGHGTRSGWPAATFSQDAELLALLRREGRQG
jgi:hypothetical protein